MSPNPVSASATQNFIEERYLRYSKFCIFSQFTHAFAWYENNMCKMGNV